MRPYKMWNPRWQPRNSCDGTYTNETKIDNNNSSEFGANPSETWRRQHKFIWIVVIKIFVINLTSQPFLATTLDFTDDIILSGQLFTPLWKECVLLPWPLPLRHKCFIWQFQQLCWVRWWGADRDVCSSNFENLTSYKSFLTDRVTYSVPYREGSGKVL